MIVGIQESISPYSLKKNTFEDSSDVEMSLEAKGSKRFRDCDV